MSTTPVTQTVVLPVTGVIVPVAAAALVIKPTGRMTTRDGEAFTANVLRDGKVIGTIEQDGHGGGTDFHPHNAEAREWFSALADEYAAIDESHRFAAHESLCNDLYEEVALARELNRKRNAVLRIPSLVREANFYGEDYDPGDDGIRVLNGPLDDRSREWARKQGEGVQVWIKGTGWVSA